MQQKKITTTSFQLLEGLINNNNKSWYDANKQDFKKMVREPFENVLLEITAGLRKKDIRMIGSHKTTFRQNRDVRFSRNKTPYKECVSGLLTPTGTKDESNGIVYLQMSLNGGFIAAGYYKLSTDELGIIRDRIIEKPREFERLLKDLEKNDLYFMSDNTLKSMPRGYSEYQNHPFAEYIKLKSFCAIKRISQKDWLDGKVVEKSVEFTKNSLDLIHYCNPN